MQLDEKEIRQIVQNLCMMNNKFMNRMLDGNIEAAEIMLRVMLEDDTIRVMDVRIQSFIQNLYGHSAQLDILAQDGLGRYFNVEMQRSDEGAPVRRARYYSSVLDTKFLQPGVDYDELPDSYVIFITENDVLGKALPLYHVNRTIDEDGTKFGDGSHIMYVNSQIQDDTALGRLMQDLYCTNPKELYYKEFAERMEYLKYNKEGEEKMTDIIEAYAQKVAKEAAKEATEKATKNTLKDMACKMLKRGDSVEEVMAITSLPLESVRALQMSL